MKENKMIPVAFSHRIEWIGDDEIYVPDMTPGTTITVCRYPMSIIKTKRLVVIEQRGDIPDDLNDINIISAKTAEDLSVDFNGDTLVIIEDTGIMKSSKKFSVLNKEELKMDNESSKYVVFDGFNPEYFKEGMIVVIRSKPGKIFNINMSNNIDGINFRSKSIDLFDKQFMIGYIQNLTESTMIVSDISKTEDTFVLKASDRDNFIIYRLDEVVILAKSEYDSLIGLSKEV